MHFFGATCKRIFTLIHMIFLKVIYGQKFTFHGVGVVSCDSHVVINEEGTISFGERIGVRRRCEFSASEKGKVLIGNDVFFNNSCMVVAHNKVIIGDGTRFGPNVMIYDHDYDYKDRKAFQEGRHISAPIIIGNNCWIGAGAIILKGTKLGDECVVGAGCVVKGEYHSKSVIIQKKDERIVPI